MHRFSGYWWSPDSRALAYQQTDTSKVEQFAIVDPTHPERGASVFPYPRPGKQNAQVRLGIVAAEGGATRWLAWDAARYPYLATVRWPKKGPLTLLVQNRPQTEQVLLAVDPATGKTRTLLTETDKAWLNLDQSFPHWLEDGSGFVWFTERNGGPELELRAPGGARTKSLVPPSAGYASFVGYVEKTQTLYFLGSPDPTEYVLYRAVAGRTPERLAFGLGTDKGLQTARASKDGEHLALVTSTLRQLPAATVHRADGEKVADLPSIALEPPFWPTTEIVKVGEGEGLYAAVLRPRDFKPGQKYPVILQVYGGPHHLEVRHSAREELILQWLADKGFIVVKADNRGTTNRRGRAFERVIKHDLGGIPLDDQVIVLRALAKRIPELDLGRVGVQGWSYGGYLAALALLRYPDVFRAGVAGAPVVDWRDYDTHYTERYMGMPDAQARAYEKASALSYADRLQGQLLLIHGTADDNVYFFHTLKLSDALFRAGKAHHVLPLSDFTHMVADPLVTQRLYGRILQHFVDALVPRQSTK
jgi:dipeptidyl-peptidase 4